MTKRIRPLAELLVLLAVVASACAPTGATPNPQNLTRPGNPVYVQLLWDCNTGKTLPADYSTSGPIQPDAGCDIWEINRYERPFNAQSQDTFFPDLDILSAELGTDGNWFYFRMSVFDKSTTDGKLDGSYAIEMDLDRDGRGDVLLLAHAPGDEAAADWTTQGVQVWGDSNNDVGDSAPLVPDPPNAGNGYDTKLFGQVDGEDPNLAWVRVHPGKPATLELAFKASAIYFDSHFKWRAWTDEGVNNPADADYQDTFDHPVAGDPIMGQTYFPSKSLNELDNTCAVIWGGPQGKDADLCVNDPSVPAPTLQPGPTPNISNVTPTECTVPNSFADIDCTPTPTPTVCNVDNCTPTPTPTVCNVDNCTSTPTPTQSNTPTDTSTLTNTPTDTPTACVVVGALLNCTSTPTPTPTKTKTPYWTDTPTKKPTREPTDEPTKCIPNPTGGGCP